MSRKISLTGARMGWHLSKLQAAADDIGLNSGCLNRAAVGCVIAGCGQFQRCPVVHRKDCLYRTLAESLGPEYQRTAVILQGAGDNLGGGS